MSKPYRDFNSYLRQLYGCRVQKISLDAGLTCPNRDGSLGLGGCIYCNPRGSGTEAAARRESLARQLESAKSRLKKRYKAKKFLAYFQSYSNTYAPLPVLKALYAEALSVPDVVGLCIGTRPDCVSNEVLDHLRELSADHLIWLEYGLQSAKDRTLERINRQHSAAQFAEAVARTKGRNLPVCAHVILGLPGETRQDMLDTARFLARMQVEAVKIHLLYIVQGTALHSLYQGGDYRCLEQEEYCALVGDFLSLLPEGMIIQRLTGDPHPEELVAPSWSLDKQNNLRSIQDYMLQNNLVQGARHEN
ncbi:MAG: TIGR01212 family radical SAM protein [Desulfohalobiaceae bacterium]|nr:TIGR01212 family radical SAM protein [Desulfohalobiaceae bacterium]